LAADNPRFIRHLSAGRKSAFNELVYVFKDRVFNTAYRFLGDWQEANSVARELFLSANGNTKSFKDESRLSAWIYRKTLNICKDKLKGRESLKNGAGFEGARGAQNSRFRDMPHRLFGKKELELSVQAALMVLPAECREIVLLRDIEGLSYGQIAEILGVEGGAVKSKLSEARFALKGSLAGLIDA